MNADETSVKETPVRLFSLEKAQALTLVSRRGSLVTKLLVNQHTTLAVEA